MDGVLRPVVAGEPPAWLGINVVAVQSHQRPFLRRQTDAVEIGWREAEVVKLAHGIGLQIDADAERPHVADSFEHDAWDADLVQRERRRQPANAAAGDDHSIIGHNPVQLRRRP